MGTGAGSSAVRWRRDMTSEGSREQFGLPLPHKMRTGHHRHRHR
jgi:hypothetical protein